MHYLQSITFLSGNFCNNRTAESKTKKSKFLNVSKFSKYVVYTFTDLNLKRFGEKKKLQPLSVFYVPVSNFSQKRGILKKFEIMLQVILKCSYFSDSIDKSSNQTFSPKIIFNPSYFIQF
jgi:hypothetical protein